MEKKELNIKEILSFFIIFLIGIILMFLGMAFVGNKAETFNDIILEIVAYEGTNQTGELRIFWSVLFAGIPILLFINYLINKNKKQPQVTQLKTIIAIEIVINVANIMFYIITGNFNTVLVIAAIVGFVNYLLNPNKQKEGFIVYIIIYYFLLAICAIANNRGISIILNANILMIIALIIDIIILSIDNKKQILNKAILILQVFIPTLLVLYMCKRYIYNEQILYLKLPTVASILILSAMFLMIGWAIYNLIKKWSKINQLDLSQLVLTTTCMIIFAVNSVGIETLKVVPDDLHHTAENIISYQQILGKGQVAYKDYSPVSGLFPVFIGAVVELFGGDFTSYNIAHAVFMLFFASITMYVLSKHLNKEDCLLISVMFMFQSYNRTVFILLTLLILLLPKLIQNKNLWLKVWIWLCFIGGIYYPTFGGAVLIGTLPFAIVQIIQYIKQGEFSKDIKTVKFYVWWIVCLLPIILFLPMLLNMAKHILLYSSQTNLADRYICFWTKGTRRFYAIFI